MRNREPIDRTLRRCVAIFIPIALALLTLIVVRRPLNLWLSPLVAVVAAVLVWRGYNLALRRAKAAGDLRRLTRLRTIAMGVCAASLLATWLLSVGGRGPHGSQYPSVHAGQAAGRPALPDEPVERPDR